MKNPFLEGCTCTKISDVRLNHFFLVGDAGLQALLLQCEGKVEDGTLKVGP